jgi:hypothetical protein
MHEVFSDVYRDIEVLNKTEIHRLVAKFHLALCLTEGGGHFEHRRKAFLLVVTKQTHLSFFFVVVINVANSVVFGDAI